MSSRSQVDIGRRTEIHKHAALADRRSCAARAPAVRDHRHVKRSSQLSRDRALESTLPRLAPLARGSEPQPLRHPPHMSIHGQDVPSEGVEHDAQSIAIILRGDRIGKDQSSCP